MSPRRHFVPTTFGDVELVYGAQRTSDCPLVIMIHGAMRHVVGHIGWFSHFGQSCDVALIELPGHGQAPELCDTTLAAFISAFDEAIRARFMGRPIVAVGESVGGLVALGLQTAQRIIALDPPLRTGKLWPLRREAALLEGLAPSFWSNIFGIGADPQDRNYWELVSNLRAPALILTGDRPLGEPRPLRMPPAFLDAEDRLLLEEFPHVTVRVIPGVGHALLDEALPQCLEAVRREVELARTVRTPHQI